MPANLAIRVLGPLEVERDGRVLPIGSPMQRRLLTALLLAEGATVSTDALVDALWDTDPPASARNSLQTYVARLRDALDDPTVIATRPSGYALDTDRVTVDAWTFRDVVHATRSTAVSDPDRAVPELAAGLAAWRGDAYGEFAGGLARDAATGLEGLRFEAAELLAGAHLRLGAVGEALSVLDRLPPGAALREPTLLLRVRALVDGGRVPDALTAIRAYREQLADELGLDPSPAVADVERRILRGGTGPATGTDPDAGPDPAGSPDPGRRPVRPPRLTTATFGRDGDRRRIEEALAVAPLVTLVGPGGVGKTHLARLVAAGGESAWVDLAPVRTAEEVALAFAEGIGMPATSGAATVELVPEALSRFRGLVVVDNCEHVLDAVAGLLDGARSRDGHVRVLATSRERLDVPGERVLPVGPLPTPTPDEATAEDPAIQLFTDGLAAAGGGTVGVRDAAEVVAAVDGLPLAIELAAARAAALPVPDLLVRLRERIDVLDGSRRRHGDRHRTLEAVIDWSHDLMEPPIRILFRRLAVFSATFRLADAERICAGEDLTEGEVAPALARLVDASLLTRREDGRFRLLEPLRLYAAVRLAASDDTDAVRERQRLAALELTALADERVSGPHETTLVREVEMALPDLRAVHARALAAGDLATVARMTAELYRFAYLRARPDVLAWGGALAGVEGPTVPAGDRARAVAAAASGAWMAGDPGRARALAAEADTLATDTWARITVSEVSGDTALEDGDTDAAMAAFTENLACARSVGHAGLAALAESSLAFAVLQTGDRSRADALARAARDAAVANGAPSVLAMAEYVLGEVLADDDPDAALEAFARALSVARAGRARFQEGIALTADVALRGRHGPAEEALARYREALEVWRDTRAEGLLQTALRNLVVLLVRSGADEPALELHGLVERLAPRPSYGTEARRLDAAVAAASERLGGDPPAPPHDGPADLVELASYALHLIEDPGT